MESIFKKLEDEEETRKMNSFNKNNPASLSSMEKNQIVKKKINVTVKGRICRERKIFHQISDWQEAIKERVTLFKNRNRRRIHSH